MKETTASHNMFSEDKTIDVFTLSDNSLVPAVAWLKQFDSDLGLGNLRPISVHEV